MAKCIKCGRKGLFLRLNAHGYCAQCASASATAATPPPPKIVLKPASTAAVAAPVHPEAKPQSADGFRSTLYPNVSGLYPQEILALQYAEFSNYCVDENKQPQFWWNSYSVKNLSELLKQLHKKGFLAIGSIEDSMHLYKLPELKAVLSAHNLKVTGKKDELIQRLSENVSANELRSVFTRQPYLLTDAGREAIKDDDYVLYIHRHSIADLNLFSLNRLLKGDTKRYRDKIWVYCNNKGLEYAKAGQFGLYSTLRFQMSRFLCEENRYKEATALLAECVYYELSGISGSYFNVEIMAPSWFPYDQSIIRTYHGDVLRDYQAKLDLSDADFEKLLAKGIEPHSLPFHAFTKEECVQIMMAEMHGNTTALRSIYDRAKARLAKKYPKINFSRS